MGLHTTLTQCVNACLIELGKDIINNIDEPISNLLPAHKTIVSIIRNVIDDVIFQEQKRFRWAELKTRFKLSKISDPTDDTPYYQFGIPADVCSRIKLESGFPYHIEGKFLYTNDAEATLIYTRYDRNNVADWSNELYNCVWSSLAVRTALKLTDDNNRRLSAEKTYVNYLSQASMVAAIERESPTVRGGGYQINQSALYLDSYGRDFGNATDSIQTKTDY